MTKYIVRNCPAIIETTFKNKMCYCNYAIDCQNISDCLIKKIIGKIQNKAIIGGICETAEEIFDLFEINEVLND